MPNDKSQTTNPLLGKWGRCGWCGTHMPETELENHINVDCEGVREQMRQDFEREQMRNLENQLWEEEHAAGRI